LPIRVATEKQKGKNPPKTYPKPKSPKSTAIATPVLQDVGNEADVVAHSSPVRWKLPPAVKPKPQTLSHYEVNIITREQSSWRNKQAFSTPNIDSLIQGNYEVDNPEYIYAVPNAPKISQVIIFI